MITEKQFSLSHAAFWHQLLPSVEGFVRECNAEANRYLPPLDSTIPAKQRGMVNEVAFRLFAEGIRVPGRSAGLSFSTQNECIRGADDHIRRMRGGELDESRFFDAASVTEAMTLAGRLEHFLEKASKDPIVPFPPFIGCGWLDSCQADILADGVLFEVKAGERDFRGSDLRQILCYCALNFASKSYDIRDICLVNPRSGRYVSETLERLCVRVAGLPAVEVLGEIVEYVSEPPGRYAIG